jgi:SPX domain protein involved in polyphosphate accumulation
VSVLGSILVNPAGQRPVGPHGVLDHTVFQRYEYKYVIPPDLMGSIRSFLRPYCEMDWYAAREEDKFYTITSLYLDTSGYKTYWDKEHEAPTRFKLRIRTYGRRCEGPVKFEVKRRLNEVSRKSWVVVPSNTWPTLLTAPADGFALTLRKSEKSALDEFVRLTRTLAATPKMLVRYQRQAFTSRIDRYVRISFDRRLCYQPARGYDLMGRASAWRFNDDPASVGESGPRIILELKFMTTAPLWLVDLVRTFNLTRRGFSKYGTAVARTLYADQDGRELLQAIPSAGSVRKR